MMPGSRVPCCENQLFEAVIVGSIFLCVPAYLPPGKKTFILLLVRDLLLLGDDMNKCESDFVEEYKHIENAY